MNYSNSTYIWNVVNDNTKIAEALQFTAEKHKLQNTPKTSYIDCYAILCRIDAINFEKYPYISRIPLHAKIVALLHDSVKDIEEIKNRFGNEIASIVKEVTDDKVLKKKLQIENTKTLSYAAKLVKLSNLSQEQSDSEKKGYAIWSRAVVRRILGSNPLIFQAWCPMFESIFKNWNINDLSEEEETKELEEYYKNLKN